jgi:hypothetical protein
MNSESDLKLSGPFDICDSCGRIWRIEAIRISNEGYGIFDIYVDLASPMEETPLHEDAAVIRQILSRLRLLGYRGPDFGAGDPGMQDDALIVLEAGEEFSDFAQRNGWRNLSDDFACEMLHDDLPAGEAESAAFEIYSSIMHRLMRT